MYPLDDLTRDGFMVLTGFLEPARRARLLEVAEGLRARYLQRDPLTGRRGFQVSPWHVALIDHPGFYEDAPDWWLPEVLELEADTEVRALWQAGTGEEPTFVYGALYMDPPLPYAADVLIQRTAAQDGAGVWHRDVKVPRPDDAERAALLENEQTRDDRHLLEIALLPSDAFEYVPGSHVRWDTPLELVARKHGTTMAERTQPLPGGHRVGLQPGDAVLIDGRGIHRGWYLHGVPRRTLTLVYSSMQRLLRYDEDDERPRCYLQPSHLERVRPGTRAFFERQLQHSVRAPVNAH
jgi:hypothetical protein